MIGEMVLRINILLFVVLLVAMVLILLKVLQYNSLFGLESNGKIYYKNKKKDIEKREFEGVFRSIL